MRLHLARIRALQQPPLAFSYHLSRVLALSCHVALLDAALLRFRFEFGICNIHRGGSCQFTACYNSMSEPTSLERIRPQRSAPGTTSRDSNWRERRTNVVRQTPRTKKPMQAHPTSERGKVHVHCGQQRNTFERATIFFDLLNTAVADCSSKACLHLTVLSFSCH
jgi:hypothetical protein